MSQPDRALIQAMGTTDATKALVIGNSVYDPLLFSRQLVCFSRRQYLFLNNYRLGVSLAEAALKSEMTPEQAERFLKRPRTRAWLEDRAKKDHIRKEWNESNKWWEMGNDVLEGKRHLAKDQQVVYLEFGKRVCPEAKAAPDARPIIQINIDPSAVQEAFRRQNAIETELEKIQ